MIVLVWFFVVFVVFFFFFFFFFFQAEDGIRDGTVTGVQTCALPISVRRGRGRLPQPRGAEPARRHARAHHHRRAPCLAHDLRSPPPARLLPRDRRRRCAARHLGRARTRSPPAAGLHPGRRDGGGRAPHPALD